MVQEYLKLISEITSGKQLAFTKWLLANGATVNLCSYKDIFVGTDVETKLRKCNLEVKQCYANAAHMCMYNNFEAYKDRTQEMYYVEGYASVCGGIIIEHGWNCLVTYGRCGLIEKTQHFDITQEYVLSKDIEELNKEEYFAVQIYSRNELLTNMCEQKCYGPYLTDEFNKRTTNN